MFEVFDGTPSSKGVSLLFDWLRTTARGWVAGNFQDEISPDLHLSVLDTLISKVKSDNPDHISFNGQSDCFIEVSSIPWTFSGGFTVSYWINIPEIIPNKSFELFRCKSPLLSVEVVLLAKSETGVFSVRVVSSSEKRGRDEMRGDILISPGCWHFLTIKYVGGSGPTSNIISFSVDGSNLLESKLTYPVVSQSLETLWTFGNSFNGLISSITLFSGDVNQNLLHFLHSLGPHIGDFGKGSSAPQSSYDSGFSPLGTLFTRGPWTKVHKLPRVFCINSMTVKSSFTLSLVKSGRQFQDFVSFSSTIKQDSDQSFMVGLHGKCTTVQGSSCVEHIYNSGGVSLLLYLFWTYACKIGKLDASSDLCIKELMKKLLLLLQQLISCHVDMKEQFLQIHGFHLLSHCLFRACLDTQEVDIIDASMISSVVEVVLSLGLDATKGDGVASALQGLLLDLRLWGQTSLINLKLVLEAAGGVSHNAGDQLYNAIGIQRLLDIVRVHLSKSLTVTSKSSEENKRLATDCADEIHRMLIMMKDSAYTQAQKQKSNISIEIDCLLGCLEETNVNLLAERILRLLIQTRHTSPLSMKRSMMNYRYLDTTIISIWTKKGVSLEVRSNAFKLLLWMLNVELQALPEKLYDMRRNVRFVGLVNSSAQSRKLKLAQADINRIKQGLAQLKEESRGLSKIWRNLWMLAEVLERGFTDETWGVYPVMLPAGNDNIQQSQVSSDLLTMISDVSLECQRSSWLYLPFLVPLLSRATIESAVKTMMIVNVEFKTDEQVIEAIMATEQELWINMFLKLTWMGCKYFDNSSGELSIELETLSDISAETFSIIAEYVMRLSIDEDSTFWSTVMDLTQTFAKTLIVSPSTNNSSSSNNFQFVFMRRVIYLVLQRIVKTNEEGWNIGLVQSVNIVLDMISKNSYHKFLKKPVQGDLLLEMDQQMQLESKYYLWTLRESEQLLYFLLDLLNALLRVSKKVNFSGIEWFAMLRVYNLIVDCMADVSDAICDSLLKEIHNFILKASELSAPFTENEFMSLIVKTFQTMGDNIFKMEFSDSKRIKLEGTVFRIIGHFTDLRLRMQDCYEIAPHVRKTVEALRIVSQMADIKMIFDVLEQTFKVSQPSIISFDDYSADESSMAVLSTNNTNTGNNLLDFTEAGEGILPPIPNEEPPSSSSDASATVERVTDVTPIDTSILPVSTPNVIVASSATARYARAFPQWLALRQGIIAERIDTERARLTRAMTLQDIIAESTKKFWRRLRRKLESEIFQEAHYCQWKLGIAHEGPFFGRKRLIVRPRYDNFYGSIIPSPMHQQQHSDSSGLLELDLSSDELTEALQRKYSGYIKDVTLREGNETGADNINSASADEPSSSTSTDNANTTVTKAVSAIKGREYVDLPGGGWGMVGADGSEEGFGVVGMAQDFSTSTNAFPEETLSPNSEIHSVSSMSDTAGNAINNSASKGKPPATAQNVAIDDNIDKVRLATDAFGEADELYRSARATIETAPCQAAIFKIESAQKIEAKVVMITASGTCWGVLTCNGEDIYFRSAQEQSEARKQDHASVNAAKDVKMRRRRWKVENISYIYLRRYRLRDSALEIFFRKGKHRSFFVDFGHTREDAKLRNEFAKTVSQVAPSTAFKQTPSMSAFRMVYEHDSIQEKWLQGKISNFDYLMALNTIAGRSFNDLCQYPVMPWVISDYTSSTINLQDANIYRDLSKPMGALNATRLKEFLDRFHSFEDNVSSGIPAFMYGSHYSTMVGVVLHFLVRLQPFAALHQEMQNGHFDVPDRLFSSIPRSYAHNTNQLSEVKELIPEFFTNPDIFRNVNNFNFGETQDGENIDNVELPPWAKTPEEFVRIHRDALESDYVSEHLHEWIDLIFGYKQRGPDAVEACNVFYYLTYYGSVDHYLITDEAVRKATELQIAHFGQTPMQLFKTPHPARRMHKIRAAPTYLRSLKDCFLPCSRMSPVMSTGMELTRLVEPKNDEEAIATEAPATLLQRNANTVVVSLLVHLDRVTLVLDTGVIDVVKFSASEEVKAVLQAAKEASKEEALLQQQQQQQQAALAASNRDTGNAATLLLAGSTNSTSSRRASTQSQLSTAAATNTEFATSSSTSSFPEDFLFPPTQTASRGRSGSAAVTASSHTTEDLLGLDGTNSMDSSTSSATSSVVSAASGLTFIAQRQLLTLPDGVSLFHIEREVHHFDTLPRLPISKKLVQLRMQHRIQQQQQQQQLSSSSTSSTVVSLNNSYPVQSSETMAEAMASLVLFSRNNALALTIGAVDGSIQVREMDHKQGAIKSAADFCVHRCRVISASVDQNGREYHLVASLDEQGTILVWTIYAPKAGTTAAAAANNNGGNGNNFNSAGSSGKETGTNAASGNSNTNKGNSIVSSTTASGSSSGGNVHAGSMSNTNASSNISSPATLEQEYFARMHFYTIGRRPQRRFHIDPTANMRVQVSWAMGLVVALSGLRVHLFSIERDELLRVFDVTLTLESAAGVSSSSSNHSSSFPKGLSPLDILDTYVDVDDEITVAKQSDGKDDTETATVIKERNHRECSVSGPMDNLFTLERYKNEKTDIAADTKNEKPSERHIMRRFVVSDFGMIVTHIESVIHVESVLEYEDSTMTRVHRLVAQTISGQTTAVVQSLSPVTCMVCPDRAEVICVGHKDASVVFYRVQDMQVLYRWQPEAPSVVCCPLLSAAVNAAVSVNAVGASVSASGTAGSRSRAQTNPQSFSQYQQSQQQQLLDTSSIVTISFGPSPANPAVMIFTTEAGNLYFQAMPDFVRWERNRNPTVLQLASEQLQAVKGTILQAQNWGAETAGVLAQNAMAELKKIRNNSIVKGVFGFFGAAVESDNTTTSVTNAGNNNSTSSKTAKKK